MIKAPLSGDDLRNTLHLVILHDTNVSDRHIEKLVELIEQEVTKAGEAGHVIGFKNGKSSTLHHLLSKQVTMHGGRHNRYKPVQVVPVSTIERLIAELSKKAGDAD